MNTYYVYMYFDLDNVPFYVGKGRGARFRVLSHLGAGTTNRLLKNKIRKIGKDNVEVVFIHKNLTEIEAFHYEKYWIKYHGRRDLGTGSLCNLTDGGEGTSGYRHSAETKKKLSEMNKGNIHTKEAKWKIGEWSKSFVRTVEHCSKMRAAQKGIPRPQIAGENHGMYGKSHSIATKLKIGKSRKGKCIGEGHSNSKLTKGDVFKIRAMFNLPNYDRRTTAKVFGVSPTVITNVVKRKTWIHI